MKHLILLIITVITIKQTKADCHACLLGNCYTKNLIHGGDILGQLAIDLTTNDLYYQYEEATGDYVRVVHNLDTNERENLPRIADYLPLAAVDQKTRDVYLGSSKGVYVYKIVSNITQFLGLRSISQLQFKDRLYFSNLFYGLFFVEDGDVYYYTALDYTTVDDFVIDKNDDIFYRSGAKIFKFKHPASEYLFTHRFAKLAVDVNGELYYSVFSDVFKFNYESGEFDSVGLVANSNMFDHVFDRDNNLVYYDIQGPKGVFTLSLNEDERCSVENKQIVTVNSVVV